MAGQWPAEDAGDATGHRDRLGRVLIKRLADRCPLNLQQRPKSGHRTKSQKGQNREVIVTSFDDLVSPNHNTVRKS